MSRSPSVLVGPKGNDVTRYRGAWLLKPNEAEADALPAAGAPAGDTLDDAVARANRAAGIVVCRFGAAVASPQELAQETPPTGIPA